MEFSGIQQKSRSFRAFFLGAAVIGMTVSAVTATRAYAATDEVVLAKIVSDNDPNSSVPSDLRMAVDANGNATAIRYYFSPQEVHEVAVNDLSKTPVLYTSSGKDVFKLFSEDFNVELGGKLDFIYINNGITNSYKTLSLMVTKTGSGWVLQVQDSGRTKDVNTLSMKMNLLFGQVIGIDSVTAEYTSTTTRTETVLSDSATQDLQLVHVTSDAMSGYEDLKLIVDQNFDVVGLRLVSDQNNTKEFGADQLSGGIVLLNQSGHDILTLKSDKFDSRTGGPLDLIYLENGLFGSTGTFSMELVRNGNHWAPVVDDQDGRREFSEMFLAKNTMFGQTVGIQSVTVK